MLAPGTRLGSYEIKSALGAGGMGEVYRARDHELGRDVAIKVLLSHHSNDADHLARLQREATTLATLNHPHIAQIYGVTEGRADAAGTTVRGLILELVEGDTLAVRLARSPQTASESQQREHMKIARQIAEALEAAHARGIIHRDLKPANIKVTPGGVVKVLDFGLAKIASADAAADLSDVPTLTATHEGLVVGTVPYMSPEQARGAPVDKRTDVWAFGCVLYELLTGRRAFMGATTADVLAAVMSQEPDWSRIPASVPATIRRVVQRCLQKDPDQRFRDIGDVRILIEDGLAEGPVDSVAREPARRVSWVWAAGALVGLLAAGGLVWNRWLRPTTPVETVRVSISAPGPITPQLSGAISPDGRQLAFVATGPSGKTRLWVRPLESLDAHELPGTDRAAHPFWSPDSHAIGFIADGKLKRVDAAGGPVQVLAETVSPYRAGAAWSRDGTIVFSLSPGELGAVAATGGPVRTVLAADREKKQTFVAWPDFLPDGRHFLYFAASDVPSFNGVHVASLDSTETTHVLTTDVKAKYAEPGYLLFLRDETMMAQSFDVRRFELGGEPMPIADGVWFSRVAHHGSFSVSQTGVLAYVNASQLDRQLVWFDRSGRTQGPVEPASRSGIVTPQLSPDGRQIAIERGEFRRGDVWIIDAALGTSSRVTFSAGGDGTPFFSASGRRLLVQTGPRVSLLDLDRGGEDVVFESAQDDVADWSRDGRFVLLTRGGVDLWAVDLSGDKKPFPYVTSPVNETQAQISPDGHWVAYTSNESGRDEVYLQRFPVPGGKRQISTDGGAMPRWRGDGKELFYLAADQFMSAMPMPNITAVELGPIGPAARLFRTRLIVQGSESSGLPTAYDVSANGQRFLLNGPPENPDPPMTLVLNWIGALKK
jgi:serine/threonine protein kinase/Tol biopolymer transport system component